MSEADDKPCAADDLSLHWLWHLQAIKLIDENAQPLGRWKDLIDGPESKSEEVKTKSTLVAVIDNGVARCHPNLDDAIAERIDFSIFPRGAVVAGDEPRAPLGPEGAARVRALLDAINAIPDHHWETGDALKALLQEDYQPAKREDIEDASARFGSHGTASAGLVAARPSCGAPPRAADYCGVDPTARILSINTLYSHEFWPIIMALAYAVARDVDVILLPRPVDDRNDMRTLGTSSLRRTRIDDDRALSADQALFEAMLGYIAGRIPVVVAAGNDGRERLSYPARLVEGAAPDLIVAGAATAEGRIASYSSIDPADLEGRGPTVLYAPSNDGQIYARFMGGRDDAEKPEGDLLRYDEETWRGDNVMLSGLENTYAGYAVVSTDIQGNFGYGADTGVETDGGNGSLYALFGGTSAAAAIIAGAASLVQRRERANGRPRLSGRDMKRALYNARGPFVRMIETTEDEDSAAEAVDSLPHLMLDASRLF